VTGVAAAVVPCASQAGSGSLPAREIPSWGVRLDAGDHPPPTELARLLRTGVPAILPRLADGFVLFDARTLLDHEIPEIARRLAQITGPR
jgi:L-seryl-tRNA(Ser) seleniumtransferase